MTVAEQAFIDELLTTCLRAVHVCDVTAMIIESNSTDDGDVLRALSLRRVAKDLAAVLAKARGASQ